MDDEELFRRSMQSLGVTPLERRERRRGEVKREPDKTPAERPGAAPPADDEDALFLASMEGLEALPNKDRLTAPAPARIRRLKSPKRRAPSPEAELDLHGYTSEEALARLERFVASASAQKMKTVIVVTGKGLRSKGGVSVLKRAVERWLAGRGTAWTRAYSEAPRAMGGRGAYLLHLR